MVSDLDISFICLEFGKIYVEVWWCSWTEILQIQISINKTRAKIYNLYKFSTLEGVSVHIYNTLKTCYLSTTFSKAVEHRAHIIVPTCETVPTAAPPVTVLALRVQTQDWPRPSERQTIQLLKNWWSLLLNCYISLILDMLNICTEFQCGK